jgi:hypothetical protein
LCGFPSLLGDDDVDDEIQGQRQQSGNLVEILGLDTPSSSTASIG